MTTPTYLPIRDSITGDTVNVWPNPEAHPDLGGGRHIVIGSDAGDIWLTPTGARALAAELSRASAELTEAE